MVVSNRVSLRFVPVRVHAYGCLVCAPPRLANLFGGQMHYMDIPSEASA
jgi:hypothetical protein